MNQYRLKLILEDGRKVYASKRGQIELCTKEKYEKLLPAAMHFAFTKDLTTMSPLEMMKSLDLPYVRIVAVEPEPSSDPIDPNAFIPGS